MSKNMQGEDMLFRWARPVVTDHETNNLLQVIQELPANQCGQEDLEEVLAKVGRHVVGGYGLPGQLRQWWDGAESGMKALVRIGAQATVFNAYYITNKRVEQATFALVGLEWLETGTP